MTDSDQSSLNEITENPEYLYLVGKVPLVAINDAEAYKEADQFCRSMANPKNDCFTEVTLFYVWSLNGLLEKYERINSLEHFPRMLPKTVLEHFS